MAASRFSPDDGWLPVDVDLGQIFIARQEQLDLFSFYLDRWLGGMPAFPDSQTMMVPSPNERIQGLLVLLYGRGGFGKSTLLKHYHDMVSPLHQKFLVSKIVDWEFAAEGRRHLFQGASRQEVDATEYFLLLCDRLAHALAKQINEFKEYQKAVKVIEEARKQMDNELRRLKEDDRYAWMRKLVGNGLVIALRQFVVPLRPFLNNQTIAGTVEEGIDTSLKVTQRQLDQLVTKLREKMGPLLNDSLDPALRLGFALGQDLANWARNFPLLIFFDTYEEVDEADTLLRLVMGRAGARVGWVLAGRDNLWAGVEQRKRMQSKSYGYKEIATPGRALSVDFNAGGLGAFTPTEIVEYFTQLGERLPADVSLSALTEDEAQKIMEVTQGVPLAVKIAAGLYQETGDIRVISQEGEGRREIVDVLVERYLLHTHDDQQERARLYGLALLRRPDRPMAVAAALGLSLQQAIIDYEPELSRLQRRYSFIFTEKAQPALHQEVRHFLRLWLLAHRTEPQILAINESLKQAHVTALNALEDRRGYGDLKERLQDEEWIGLYLDLTEQQFWLDPGEGVCFCLSFMIAAAIYQRPVTQDAAKIGAFFVGQIKGPFHIWWKWIIHSLSHSHNRDTSNEALIGLTELVSLMSQREVHFPMPFASFSGELEAALWWRLGEVYMNKDDYKALECYERALTQLSQEKELREATTEAYRQVARQLYNKSKFTEGLPFSQRAVEISPDYANAYSSRGAFYRDLEQYEQAFADYTQALTLDPHNVLAYTNRGLALAQLKQYEAAFRDFIQAFTLDPKDARPYLNRAAVYMCLDQYDQALIDLNQAIALDSYYVKAYFRRGDVYRHTQQYEQAIADYTQVLTLDPKNMRAYLARGDVYRHTQQYEQAIADYTQILTLGSYYTETSYLRRAYAYLFLKMLEQAQTDFIRYATLNSKDVNAAWMVLYSSLGKRRPRGEIAERLESIAVLDPQSHEACICRGIALGLRGKLQEGLAELEHALQLKAKSEDALFWKGMICAYIGRSLEAIEFIEQAIQAGLPPMLLTPLYWLEQDKSQFYHEYAEPLLKQYEVDC